mmetsp:Transcript_23486/g.41592  ORF Transcript_23486/g.41592 Transcript_23486/m.41592 type:complete len:432 (+) Transcript_23486:69-1364(+)
MAADARAPLMPQQEEAPDLADKGKLRQTQPWWKRDCFGIPACYVYVLIPVLFAQALMLLAISHSLQFTCFLPSSAQSMMVVGVLYCILLASRGREVIIMTEDVKEREGKPVKMTTCVKVQKYCMCFINFVLGILVFMSLFMPLNWAYCGGILTPPTPEFHQMICLGTTNPVITGPTFGQGNNVIGKKTDTDPTSRTCNVDTAFVPGLLLKCVFFAVLYIVFSVVYALIHGNNLAISQTRESIEKLVKEGKYEEALDERWELAGNMRGFWKHPVSSIWILIELAGVCRLLSDAVFFVREGFFDRPDRFQVSAGHLGDALFTGALMWGVLLPLAWISHRCHSKYSHDSIGGAFRPKSYTSTKIDLVQQQNVLSALDRDQFGVRLGYSCIGYELIDFKYVRHLALNGTGKSLLLTAVLRLLHLQTLEKFEREGI